MVDDTLSAAVLTYVGYDRDGAVDASPLVSTTRSSGNAFRTSSPKQMQRPNRGPRRAFRRGAMPWWRASASATRSCLKKPSQQ